MSEFSCQTCGRSFSIPQATLDKYPGWTPKQCRQCKPAKGKPAATRRGASLRRSATAEEDLPLAEVLKKYSAGPDTGVFTDGAAVPNPGAGGWGAVYVREGTIIAEADGEESHTTNNRMELTALIAGFKLVPKGESVSVWTDSQLCVNSITRWAAGWERAGWKRKSGPIKNLELVQELYSLSKERPELELKWIKAHSGNLWNEYADSLATAYRRSVR